MKALLWLDWQAMAARHWLQRLLLVLLLMSAVVAVGYWVRVQASQHALEQALAQAQQLRTLHAQLRTQAEHVQAEREAVAQASARLLDSRWRLAAGEDSSDLLDQLSRAGHAHGLAFEQVAIAAEPAQADFRPSTLQIQAGGSYPALRQWLDDWLGQMRLLRVGELRLTQSSTDAGRVQAHLRVTAYHPGEVLAAPVSLAEQPARGRAPALEVDLFRPWSTQRVAGDLRGVPLEQLKMVGSLFSAQRRQALIAAAGRIHRVRVGDALGRYQGKVVAVEAGQVRVQERIFLGDMWQEHNRTLWLGNSVGNRGADERDGKEARVLGGVADSGVADADVAADAGAGERG
ncbi:pilus assembly protein PilP [Pseudomonas cremoricolorata]|uniref:pilus assembly protein PilP n=1 Tax=Pseudomonas cremoricolorata TaxID=157783 RepID=UPI000424E3F7|nr:pilus assembly protein PilP [Pseudomonas cremoricolorata]